MRAVTLTRAFSSEAFTIGMLQIKGLQHDPIFTLENPWLNNKRSISCIPTGVYKTVPFSGTKYNSVYQLLNVPSRSYILIHSGNFERNTSGCLLLGLGASYIGDEFGVTSSKKAVEYFKGLIGDHPFELIIN